MRATDMAAEALACLQANSRMSMVRMKGAKPPKGFPRGELMCENSDGRNVYSYDPAKVIAWLNANALIAIEVKP